GLRIVDEGGLESTILYPTGGLAIGWVREPDFAVALCRAYNNFVHQEFLSVSPRLKAVALLPFQDVSEAVKELRRSVTELGMCGAFAPAVRPRPPLRPPQVPPLHAESERLRSPRVLGGPPCGARNISAPTASISSSRCIRSRLRSPR